LGDAPPFGTDSKNNPKLGEEIIPAFVAALKDREPRVVTSLIKTLAELGLAAKPAVPVLRARLESPNEGERITAAEALARIDQEELTPALPVLTAGVHHPESAVRVRAAAALGKIGPSASKAAADLIDLVNRDEDADVRVQAAEALMEVDAAQAKQAVPALVALIADIDKQTKEKAKLPDIEGHKNLSNAKIDLQALRDPLAKTRSSAVRVLRRIDPDAADAAMR
jgi:HEAT repeat protein